MIEKQRVLQEFMELVAIPSSSRAERQIADVLKQKLAAIGLSVEEDNAGEKIGGNAGNLIARLPATVLGVPCIMLSAHMDSVEPCAGIRPQRKDGVITSAGDTILVMVDNQYLLRGLPRLQEVLPLLRKTSGLA